MAPILTDTHPLNPFTPGPKHSQIPISMPPSPMVHTQTPIPIPFHPWPPILTHTHPLNPLTHEPKHSQTPIPTPPSPMAHTQTPIPIPFHLWLTILIHSHPLNPFTHGPKHCQTPIPDPLYPWPRHRHPPLSLSPLALDTCRHSPLSPFTHGPNTYRHPSPKPFQPWPQTLTNMEPTVVCRGFGVGAGAKVESGMEWVPGVGLWSLDLGCGPRVSTEARGRCRDLG